MKDDVIIAVYRHVTIIDGGVLEAREDSVQPPTLYMAPGTWTHVIWEDE